MNHADLPLHYGRVPQWLASRMKTLGRAIVESIVLEYGRDEVIRRISDPLWFQSFGAVLGMDWHSSGITTSVISALKRGLNPIAHELGIYVCGGRGKQSRATPRELYEVGNKTGLDGALLARNSRLTAKIDNTAIQDGFQIYLHSFIVTADGNWTVIQQGMNDANAYARRYHWHSRDFESFISDPHTSICGQNQGLILNLTDKTAGNTQQGVLNISNQHPTKMIQEIAKIKMPAHHDVKAKDIDLKRLGSVIALAYEKDLQDFESLLLLEGLGPRTLQSLTLVSEVIYGTPSRFEDPARYSFAHGGKDGHPFPVPTKVYDETIATLRHAVNRAKIGHHEKQKALKSLHKNARKIEKTFVPNNNFEELIEKEWAESNLLGGRTVFDSLSKKERQKKRKKNNQLRLF